jgi:hypothetical protein
MYWEAEQIKKQRGFAFSAKYWVLVCVGLFDQTFSMIEIQYSFSDICY